MLDVKTEAYDTCIDVLKKSMEKDFNVDEVVKSLKGKAETTAKVEICTVDSLKSTLKKYRLGFFGNLLCIVLFGFLLGVLQLNESLGKLPLEIGIAILCALLASRAYRLYTLSVDLYQEKFCKNFRLKYTESLLYNFCALYLGTKKDKEMYKDFYKAFQSNLEILKKAEPEAYNKYSKKLLKDVKALLKKYDIDETEVSL